MIFGLCLSVRIHPCIISPLDGYLSAARLSLKKRSLAGQPQQLSDSYLTDLKQI
jgi:hypothetical protein